MRRLIFAAAWANLLGLLPVSAVLADRTTPFVESTKVGDIRTERGWVVALDPAATTYIVLVSTDTMQYVVVDAEAAPGTVQPEVLGRWASITGQVLSTGDQKGTGRARIRLLKVQRIDPPAPPATRPAATQPASGRLDFRIAAELSEGERVEDNAVPHAMAEELIRLLKEQGPQGGYDRPSGFEWFEAADFDANRLVSGTNQNRRYVLLMNRQPYVMLAIVDGQRTWGLERVYLTKELQDRTAIGFDFDAAGAELFGALTETNQNRPLAILIDGRAISAPRVRAKITRSAIISGGLDGFDAATAQAIVSALAKGMPPTTAPLHK